MDTTKAISSSPEVASELSSSSSVNNNGEFEKYGTLETPVVVNPIEKGVLDSVIKSDGEDVVSVGKLGSVKENGGGLEKNVILDVGGEEKVVSVGESEGLNSNSGELGEEWVRKEGSELKDGGVVEEKKKIEVLGSKGLGFGSTEIVREVIGDGENLGGVSEDVKADGVKVTPEGVAVVNEMRVDVLRSGVAVVGDVEQSKDLEIKGLEDVVDAGIVPDDNGFDKIQDDNEKLVEAVTDDFVKDRAFESVTDDFVKDRAFESVIPQEKGFADSEPKSSVNWSGETNENLGELGPQEDRVEGSDIQDGVVVEEKKIEVSCNEELGVESKEVAGEMVGQVHNLGVGNEIVKTDGVKVTSEGIVVVEEMNVDALRRRVAVVGVLESSKDSDIKVLEDVVDTGSVPVDNGFNKIQGDIEEPVESAANVNVETEKDGSLDMSAVVEDAVTKHDQDHKSAESEKLNHVVVDKPNLRESAESDSQGKTEVELEAVGGDEEMPNPDEEAENDTDGETDGMIFGSSEAAKRFLAELERGSGTGSHSGADGSHDHSQQVDGQIVTDSDEEADTDEDGEGEGKELFDSAALTALLKAATGASSDGSTITVTSQDGSRLFSVERPAGLGSSLRSMRPTPRPNRPNLFTPSGRTTVTESDNNLSEEDEKKLEKLQQIRVKFLRLVRRLGYSPEESIAAQVFYRLALVAGRQSSQLFSVDAAKNTALQLETEGKDDLNFSLNILVLGKTGVGKSATINSIFGSEKSTISPFEPSTTSARIISGIVDGVKISVIDSPGLKSSGSEQGTNRKILSSVKKRMKQCPPDIVLYVDRLDTQTRDLNDLPLLRSITSSLGSSIWRSAIVTLTHAASAPPDGPSGSPLSYEVFVAQRSHVVQQSIGQAVGDLRLMNPSLMNPVSLAENHPSCRKNRDGQKVLPNGQAWRPQLLLLCYSMKILSEASSLSKPQEPLDHRKLFGFRMRSPPLPYLLSWLLQSRTHPKLATDQGGDGIDSDVDLADLSDSDHEEEEDEYDQLPPFKPLRKAQLAKLTREQRKAYLEEYDYRVKLLQKKQWKEELKRMKEMKKSGKTAADEYAFSGENVDPENEGPAAVPVPLPDMVLPPSFDSDNPAYRFRFLEPTSQFLARPVLDTHGWDHDCGYDGVNVEHSLAIINRFPAAVTLQVTKDKKEFNVHLDSSVSAKHGENGSSMAGFDIQHVGKQLAYVVRGETKFKNLKRNKTAAGVSVTFLGENVATGFKLEDQISLGKRLELVGSTGTIRSQGDTAYGANLEIRLRDADFPIGQDQSSLGLSLVKWKGDLALGANLQSQISVGRSSKVAVRAGLNNKMSGQISVRTSSSEQLQLALVALLPIAMSIYKMIKPGASESYSMY